jgi:hypothetical protein
MNDVEVLALAQILFPMVVSASVYIYKKYVPMSEQQKLAHSKSLIISVVMGVEQACAAMNGPDKKSEALRLVNQLLSEAHISISPTLIDSLIEQAAYTVNQGAVDPQATLNSIPIVKK